jgi:hypothetical protein
MPTSSKNPRVIRKHKTDHRFKDSELRHEALDWLLDDFEGRCAYSMLHVLEAARHNIEVDHFDPTLKGTARNAYKNLLPAFSQCNNAKRRTWPTSGSALRYLDPSIEMDYGKHIFEDTKSGELLPISKQGVYQIENCALNSDYLRMKRRERTEDAKFIELQETIAARSLPQQAQQLLAAAKPIADRLKDRHIPPIAPPPPGALIL